MIQLFQVSESLANPATRSEEEQLIVDQGTIEVIPVWRFLLMDGEHLFPF